jgi:ubiquinol-cytochrome c reductase cytochrome c1 subunit
MFRKIAISAVSAMALTSGAAWAEGVETHVDDIAFSFEGPFGTYDEHQLQRGLQVYTEVCSACHGLKFVPIRSIGDAGGPHIPEDQVRAYAKAFTIEDRDTGEERSGMPTDFFPKSSLETAPDLSLMAKARAAFHGPYGSGINQLLYGIGGPEHIYSILNGYKEPPACAPAETEGYYNIAFEKGGVPDACKDEEGHSTVPGSWISMPPPLEDGTIEYQDGHEATLHHMSEDVSAFLMWTAEPKLAARKQTGFVAVIVLLVLSTLLYLTNKRLWADVKGKKKHA